MRVVDRVLDSFGLYVPPVPTPAEWKRDAPCRQARYMAERWRDCAQKNPYPAGEWRSQYDAICQERIRHYEDKSVAECFATS